MANNYRENYVRDTTNAHDLWCCWVVMVSLMIKAGWLAIYTSNGTTKVAVNGDASLQNFLPPMSNVGAGGASCNILARELGTFMTITGLSGLVAPTDSNPGSEGNFLTITGCANAANNGTFQIVDVLTPNSCKIRNVNGVAGDTATGWQEKDITAFVYAAALYLNKASWIVLGGPKTLRVPYTNTPQFLEGEDVTQGSGAEQRRGRVRSWTVSTGNTGWISIDPYGDNAWDTSDITGVYSGKTLVSADISATPVMFQVQYVIAKDPNSYYSGAAYWQQYGVGIEDAQAFSAIAANDAACTPSSPPGFNSAGVTSFPLTGITQVGRMKNTSAAVNQATPSYYAFGSFQPANYGPRAQILVANCISKPANGVTPSKLADGSWSWLPQASTVDQFYCPMFFARLTSGDKGDLSPFAHFISAYGSTKYNRFYSEPAGSLLAWTEYIGSSNGPWYGYAARGGMGNATARDFAQQFFLAATLYAGGGDVFTANPTVAMRSVNSPDATPPLRRENPTLASPGTQQNVDNVLSMKMIKGQPTYFTSSATGGLMATFDGYKWMNVSAYTNSSRAATVGPLDGVTVPQST